MRAMSRRMEADVRSEMLTLQYVRKCESPEMFVAVTRYTSEFKRNLVRPRSS